MKTIYIKPSVNVLSVNAESVILAGSTLTLHSDGTETIQTKDEILGKEAGSGSVWDDGDEE